MALDGARRALALVLAASASACTSVPSVVVVDGTHDHWPLLPAVEVVRGLGAAAGPDDVLAASAVGAPGDEPVWLRIDVDVRDDRALHLWASPPHDDGEVFVARDDDWERLPLPSDGVVPIDLPRGRHPLLVRLARLTRGPDRFELATLDRVLRAREAQAWFQGTYAGAALLMLGWNLVLARRSRTHAVYAALVLANLVHFALRAGALTALAPTLSPHAIMQAELAALVVSALLAVQLARELFETRRTLPRLDRALALYRWPLALLAIAVLVDLAGYRATQWVGVTLPVLALSTGLAARRRGSAAAVPYLVGWTSYFLGGLCLALPLLPARFPLTASQLFQLGSALELASFALALVTRLRVLEDESEATRERLARTERLAGIGKLAAGVAHEVNNPNNLITFNVPLLERYVTALARPDEGGIAPAVAEADARAALAQVRTASDRITAIVATLRSHAKTSGERHAEPLDGVARRAVEMVRHRAREGVRLELALAPTPAIPIARHPMEGAIVNLVVNALQAASSEVLVRSAVDRGHVLVEIEDDGPGVPEAIRERVFEPFVTGREGGTGLGLALAQETAREHGGTLSMRREGDRTIFSLRIPVPKEPA